MPKGIGYGKEAAKKTGYSLKELAKMKKKKSKVSKFNDHMNNAFK